MATYPQGINNNGQIAGWYYDSQQVAHGFLDNNGLFTSIDYPGAIATLVLGINDFTQLVGLYLDSSDNPHGFVAFP